MMFTGDTAVRGTTDAAFERRIAASRGIGTGPFRAPHPKNSTQRHFSLCVFAEKDYFDNRKSAEPAFCREQRPLWLRFPKIIFV
jgi:hypothetical protein